MNNRFTKGSEWRKWDLHVHTPESVLNNGFGANWDDYVLNLFQKALEKNVSAIGITDYFTIEGYKKLKQEYLINDSKLIDLGFTEDQVLEINKILILPNIEFRLNKLVNGNRVNFHVILSNDLSVTDLEEDFLHELEFVYQGNPQSSDTNKKLKIHHLKDLGKRLKDEHAEFQNQSDLYIGMMNAVVDDSEIMKILSKPKFGNKYLICVPSDEDLSDISWDGQDHLTRKVIIQKSDCLLCSNPKTVQWGLGELYDKEEDYIKEFKSLKPCIWGSDAHNLTELFTKNSERLLWIKSDLTFEGLYQIKYEPKDRVHIGPSKPESKRPYFVINKVNFIDGRTFPKFSSENIHLNQNLSVIIGGKSTGKSLLLYHIAKSIDPSQVEEKVSELENDDLKYDFELDPNFDFTVEWEDGGQNKLKGDTSEDSPRQITYIPQHYLSNLSKKNNFDDKKSLNNFINETLLSDEESKNAEDQAKETSRIKQRNINSMINDLLEFLDDFRIKQKLIKEKGDKKGIAKFIADIKKEIEDLKKQSTLTKEQSDKLDQLSESQKKLQKQFEEYTSDRTTISKFVENTQNFLSRVTNLKAENWNYLHSEKIKEEYNKEFKFIDELQSQLQTAENNLIGENGIVIKGKKEIEESLAKITKELNPLLANIKQKEILQKKGNTLKEEEKKLNQITLEENKLTEQRKSLKTTFDSIFAEYKIMFEAYSNYKEALLKAKEELKEVQINVKLNFNSDAFNSQISECFQKSDLKREFPQFKNSDGDFEFSYSTYEELIKLLQEILRKSTSNSLKLYKNQTLKEALLVSFEDYFYLDFSVSYKNDQLDKMSPGKRNLVLLKIIIEKNNQEWPILIDQPEDDLDNRSVYYDLVKFLKDKKKDRQVIIVTHNPNACVGADAELIVVANQSGQDKDRNNEVYDFEYITGSLENTKPKDSNETIILKSMGIREHVCDILEGGESAFRKREEKYGF